MSSPPRTRTVSRWDAVGMAFYALLGIALVVATTVTAVIRIVEVVANDGVRVFAQFAGTPADAPIGPDGTPVEIELDTAWLVAPELPVASVGALVIEQVVIVAAVAVVVFCLLMLMWNTLRGQVFSRGNTTLVATAGIAGFVGVAAAPFFGNMGANGAFAWISDRTFDNVILSASPVQLLGLGFIISLAITVFTVGDRLQRDTKGLV
ncbi:hypothetical protein ACFQZV_03660 [Microbacterium koreense]|uniref:DUF2975 domain-containing protein n=1 Tax=Microbacterium koreense TaxID=323761 RepID=A0ABW2ZPL0_9MICO